MDGQKPIHHFPTLVYTEAVSTFVEKMMSYVMLLNERLRPNGECNRALRADVGAHPSSNELVAGCCGCGYGWPVRGLRVICGWPAEACGWLEGASRWAAGACGWLRVACGCLRLACKCLRVPATDSGCLQMACHVNTLRNMKQGPGMGCMGLQTQCRCTFQWGG